MGNVDEDLISKRLLSVNQTQEAVQTCSKWMLHHRDSIDRIATCWINTYKKASDKLRIALIYVLNDVIQKAANKHDTNVTLALHPHWINATAMSNVSVKKAISRCVEVLEQRNVYPQHIIEEMKAVLVSRIAIEKDESQSGEIDFSQLVRGIESFYKNEVLTEKAREILSRSSFNFKESVQARVKDRTEGTKALEELDMARKKMVTFLESAERHQQKGMKLMEMVQQAKHSFNLQLRDVTVVNDAYEKFAEGIRETKQQLGELEKSGAFLGGAEASPPRDAPSPTAMDDPFAHGVDGEEAAEAEDMEMDEEDGAGGPSTSCCFLKPSRDYVASIPSVPEMDPRLQRLVNQQSSINPQHLHMPSDIALPAEKGAAVNMGGRGMADPRQQMLDPRQARFFPPPQQPPPQPPQQLHFPPLTLPPPGLSPPQPILDTSQPPPQIFPIQPQPMGNGASLPVTPESVVPSAAVPMAMFNPSNPPPSILSPQMMQLSSPPPTHNVHIPPPQQTPPMEFFQPLPKESHRHVGGQKRRNSAEMAGNGKQRRPSWNNNSNNHPSGRNGGDGQQNHRWSNEEGRGGGGRNNWRRSYTGGEGTAPRYRH